MFFFSLHVIVYGFIYDRRPVLLLLLLIPFDDTLGWSMGALLGTHGSTGRKLSSSLTHHRWAM